MTEKLRADQLLVKRGVFESRSQARAAIDAGGVTISGGQVKKSSERFDADADILAEPAHPWVSRAGVKLAFGLDAFDIDPAGLTCLDIGASTGGFTDVLLARGAARVIAVDVGRDQLARRLREDSRVRSLESTDARSLALEDLVGPPALIVCDASFIGLEKVTRRALELAAANADAVLLFKPQFQVGPTHVGKGGVVKDGEAVAAAFQAFAQWLEAHGWRIVDRAASPIRGGDGNAEVLVHARRI